MIRLPEIKTAELSTYGNFAKCHQALFRVPHEGLGMRLVRMVAGVILLWGGSCPGFTCTLAVSVFFFHTYPFKTFRAACEEWNKDRTCPRKPAYTYVALNIQAYKAVQILGAKVNSFEKQFNVNVNEFNKSDGCIGHYRSQNTLGMRLRSE